MPSRLFGAAFGVALAVGAAAGCSVADPAQESGGGSEGAVVGAACSTNANCSPGELCVSGRCVAWDCRVRNDLQPYFPGDYPDIVPGNQSWVANTDSACRDWCSAASPHFGEQCLHNGKLVKGFSCTLFRGGTDPAKNMIANAGASRGTAYLDAPSVANANCMAYCYNSGSQSLRMGDLCYRDGELIYAKTLEEFNPASAKVSTLKEADSEDLVSDGSKPRTLWDCAPKLRLAGSSPTSCAIGGTAMGWSPMSLLKAKANAYLTYILGWDYVPGWAQGETWNDSLRKTSTRLCWLREAVAQGKVKVRPYVDKQTICGMDVGVYHLSGTLAGVNWTGKCGGIGPTNTNPAEHVAIIDGSLRWEAGACPANAAAPTFFQTSHYHSAGDSQVLIDPEPATIASGFTTTTTGATATATGISTGAVYTAYRYGSSYPAKAGRAEWVGRPCIVGTGGSVGQVLNQVWMPSPTNANYLACAACGASGQACCPNADFATSGLSRTCDANNGLGCNVSTGKCY